MAVSGKTDTQIARTTVDMGLIGIYLNDHLAGSTTGVELVRRAARGQRHWEAGRVLDRIAAEIAEDRAGLIDMMEALRVPIRRYKICAGWVVEKFGRAKPNGRLLRRSPLSDVVELETLRLGIEGKEACWRVLRLIAERDDRLDPTRLDRLIARARGQAETVEDLRMRAAERLIDSSS
ncbi:hypothetical protein [Actinomadura sp. HBU206391]|uniref:hypothetical protein n=1 Tax=Actinomadura sp. HBU206391 TaxID=2731692 RepID=UPI00165059B8|nr:hypothetical protein [Actinomadura sp. HBU206391]MBC6462167.1 hypothetical protein [Actinomadura sp. HBU206391]